MQDACSPLRWDILEEIDPEFSQDLRAYFPDTEFLDLRKWGQGYEPDIASCFMVTSGGSAHWEDGGYICTTNGTLGCFLGHCVGEICEEYTNIIQELYPTV